MFSWKKVIQKIAIGAVILGFLIMGYSSLNYAVFFLENDDDQKIAESKTNERGIGPIDRNPQRKQGVADNHDVSQNNKQTTLKNTNTNEVKPVTIQTKLLYPERPQVGENIGTLEIPTIDASLPIIHGTDEDELEKGVGHYKGSVLPGEPDHSVLSGHRDTVFRNLKDVQLQDTLVVTTSAGRFIYEVVDIYIVDQYDQSVITPTPNATLSLTTCYPFTFVGNAPERYIIHSVLVEYELAD
jgi:sortase A